MRQGGGEFEGKEQLIPSQSALRLVGSRSKPGRTIIDVPGVRIGGGELRAEAAAVGMKMPVPTPLHV